MNPLILPVKIVAGIVLFAALHYFIVYLITRERENMSFALACLFCGIYDIFCVMLYGSSTLAEGIRWQRFQLVSLAGIAASLVWFTRHFTGYPSRKILRAIALFYMLDVFIILIIPSQSALLFGSPLIKTVRLGTAHSITYYESSGGLIMMIQNIAAMGTILYMSLLYIRHYRTINRHEARYVLAGILVIIAAAVNDMLVVSGLYKSIYVIEYAFLMLVIGMGHTLAYRHSAMKRSLKERNDELMATTEEMEATNEELIATNEELIKNQEEILALNKTLAEREELFRVYFEKSPIGMAIFAPPGGTCIRVNHRLCEMLGYSEEELLGKDWRLVTQPDDVERDRKVYARLFSEETEINVMESRLVTAGGEELNVALFARGLYDSSGKLTSVLVLVQDITGRKRVEEEKEKMQAQLVQSQKMEAIGILAGGVAHDFNNLLTAIIGTADLSLHMSDQSSDVHAMLRDIIHAASRAADLTKQMLLFSRRQPVNLKDMRLDETIVSSTKMIKRIIGENIRLSVDVQPDLPPLLADESQIEQIIMNLVINARDAMPVGGDITITARECGIDDESAKTLPFAYPGTFILLSFTDTGEGMDRDTLEHIFEPFFTTKKTGHGSGLGLSVVYGIIKKHRGWITVTSLPGKGSTFDIYLPAAGEMADAAKNKEMERRPLLGNGERILLVEDQEEVAGIARAILEKHNYTVSTAPTGTAAQKLFEDEGGRFDLLFTDIVLPDTNGVDLARSISAQKPGIRVLLTSGYPEKSQGTGDSAYGSHPFLAKPYSLSQLLEAVRASLAKTQG